MISFLSWIIFGFIVGLIARMLMPGRQDLGIFMTALLGVVGSVIGGGITWAFRGAPTEGFDPAGFVMSIIGAILALWIYASVSKRHTVT